MRRILRGLGVLLALTVLLSALNGSQAMATSVNFTNMRVGSISPGSGHVGVDITWPTSNGAYNPCHNYQDIYYGACVMSNVGQISYYKVQHYSPGSTDFPYGIFIDNQNPNYCVSASWCTNPNAQIITHGWANLVTDVAIEVYPYNSAGQYDPYTSNAGGVRVGVNSFPTFANGGRYSTQVGNINLPQLGQAGVGKLNGFVTDHGVSVGASRVAFDVFQDGSSWSTSTGYPVSGFASDANNGDGYYSTGAVPNGTYRIYITDTQTGHKVLITGVGIHVNGERLDFKLEQPCFGFSGSCQVLQ